MKFDRIIAIISLLVTIVTSITIPRIGIPPLWVIVKIAFVYFTVVVSTLLMVFLAKTKYAHRFFRHLRLTLFILIPLSTVIVLFFEISYGILPTRESQKAADDLFPQAYELGPAIIRTYATNGKCSFIYIDKKVVLGPNGYAEIKLQCYDTTVAQNCGWVYFLTKGIDISEFNELRFQIRGKLGHEKIRVKAKDAEGCEVGIDLDGFIRPSEHISTEWQYAMIPLEEFGGVKFDFFDNFSISTNGKLAGKRKQVIQVGGFELRPPR